jgi:hypothetical protein
MTLPSGCGKENGLHFRAAEQAAPDEDTQNVGIGEDTDQRRWPPR